MTNTKAKFVIVVSVTDGVIRDADMKAVSDVGAVLQLKLTSFKVFNKVHSAYVSSVCNPFSTVDSQNTSLSSPQFIRAIDAINTTIAIAATNTGTSNAAVGNPSF
jgi:hypothetical protein